MNTRDPMIKPNDPRLTDYVLGELAPSEVAQIEAALKSSPVLRAAVADIRAATETSRVCSKPNHRCSFLPNKKPNC